MMGKIKHKRKKKVVIYPSITLRELVYRCHAEGMRVSFSFADLPKKKATKAKTKKKGKQ